MARATLSARRAMHSSDGGSTPQAPPRLKKSADTQLALAGTVQHQLRLDAGALRIVMKRVDLLNAGSVLPAIRLLP